MRKDKMSCSKCGKAVNKEKTWVIDDKCICFTCIYGDKRPLEIYPIGTVRTDLRPDEIELFSDASSNISCIDLIPSQEQFMYKLEEEMSLLIVYYLHKVKSVTLVFNRRIDGKKVGVFASRTQNRLSRIAVQDVGLVKVRGNALYVKEFDAIDGSPVLDVKLGLRHLKKSPGGNT